MDLTTVTKHLSLDLFLGIVIGIILTITIYKLGSYFLLYLTKKLLNKGINSVTKSDNGGDIVKSMLNMFNDPNLQQSLSGLLQPGNNKKQKTAKRKTVQKKDDTSSDESDDGVDEMKLNKQRAASVAKTSDAKPVDAKTGDEMANSIQAIAGRIQSVLTNPDQLNNPELAGLINNFGVLFKPPAKATEVPQTPPAAD